MIYMGSKSKIAKYILPIILKDRKPKQWYIEPFCGGLNTIDKVDGNVMAFDNNPYLINMWIALQHGVNFPTNISKDFYSDVRDSYNKNDGRYDYATIGWVGFMASFNGRFFDGGYSGHNVKGRDYIAEQIRNTISQVKNIGHIGFGIKDYSELYDLPSNSIIYCDPPYKGTKQYSSSKNFNYNKFYEWCREYKRMGHTIYVSEYWMPEDFRCIWEKEVTNSLNSTKTYTPIEKLFTL